MPLGKFIQAIRGLLKQESSESAEVQKLSEITQVTTEEKLTLSDSAESLIVKQDDSGTATEFPISKQSNFSKGRNMINYSMLQQELQAFVSGSVDVQGASLVSPDGLALASVLANDMDEERTAAMSASILSLGERIASELSRGIVERIVVEGEKGYGVLVGCGSEAVLLVLAGKGVKQGILFLEVKRVVSKIAPLLA